MGPRFRRWARGTVARRRRRDSSACSSADLLMSAYSRPRQGLYAHHFRHDGNLFLSLASFQDLEPFEPRPGNLRRSSRLVGSAAGGFSSPAALTPRAVLHQCSRDSTSTARPSQRVLARRSDSHSRPQPCARMQLQLTNVKGCEIGIISSTPGATRRIPSSLRRPGFCYDAITVRSAPWIR